MKSKKVLITVPFTPDQKKLLESQNPNWLYEYTSPKQVTKEMVQTSTVIIGNLPVALLEDADQLEWMQLNSAGTEPYSNPGILSDKVILTNAGGAYGTAVSEHLFAMFVALQKKLHLYRDNQRDNLWKDEGMVNSLHGLNVLVVGLGDIGNSFSLKMHLLGNNVTGIRRNINQKPDFIKQLRTLSDLDSLIPDADVIALCLPQSAETNMLFSRKRISLMKKTSILLNGGRGTLIDTEALCDALEAGEIYSAGLDVTDPEPLPADHRIWQLKNVLITPHISGGFHLAETLEKIISISVTNFHSYLNGEKLTNIVTRHK